MGDEVSRRNVERENLRYIIQQWNSNRLDLFEISEPDENLEFHGVMRFYFQDLGQKVSTKCIRVSSNATTRIVIETLIEKFRPDMRMLSIPEYTLYEIHEIGEERRLSDEEKPLLVQLNWNKDDREGRFLLRRMDLRGKIELPKIGTTPPQPTKEQPFQRKLSRREKKELKKQEKQRRANEGDHSVAEKLYTELPETSFTRSISNPEAVMRRRRAQKLEKKLQQFRSKDGGPDTGGTLKIYGESLCQDVPYKTLLLSIRDTAANVVKEMLEKYGLYREDPNNYCLIQAVITAEEATEGYNGVISPQKEYILDDDECPLAILMNHPPSRGSIMFQVRRRPADHGPRKRKKKPIKGPGSGSGPHSQNARHHSYQQETLPFLVELNQDGTELTGNGTQHQLQHNVTEVGTDRMSTGGQMLQLFGPLIQPRHCVIAHIDGVVTVTPSSREAETYVNGQRIHRTHILQHGCIVRFGRTHNFRFIDPQQDDRIQHISPQTQRQHHEMFVTANNYERYPPAREPILPAVLEFREDTEDALLHNITSELDPTDVQFKLAPTYTLYMAARFRASTYYRPDLTPTERAHSLTIMLSKVAVMVQNVIQSRHGEPTSLAFWMANASELLHFLKQDRHICGYSVNAQDILAEAVQVAFSSLVDCMQSELSTSMPLFLEDRDDRDEEEGSTAHVLSILSNTMALLRRCRVNAALTIQLFSHLFHYVNMWVFNRVITQEHPNYCTRIWGERIKERLGRIELWAEKQGLELAADCHLARLSQAAMLLIAPKDVPDDMSAISSTCFKLNSLQLRALLEKYQPAINESQIPMELVENVVAVAESTADGLARVDGRDVRLEEEGDLQLPFLLPEDGYSCDIVRGVPSGLAEFLSPLQNSGLCRMNPQPTSSGYWTIYMHDPEMRAAQGPRSPSVMSNRSMSIPRGEPEVHIIQLHKSNNGMGLSIVATMGVNQDQLGIYIKGVVPGGAADQDGRLQAGDQLLSVDGKSLIGITQEQAAEYMMQTGPVVTLEVARQGAIFHGLATLLSQQSPQVSRGFSGGRHASERDIPSKVIREHDQERPPVHHQPPHQHTTMPPMQHQVPQPRMQASKSVPSLNSELSMGVTNSHSAHEMLNSGYSRTSSSTSLSHPSHFQQYQQQQHPPNQHQASHNQQQQHQYQNNLPIRSRSTQNLTEGGLSGLNNRHPSNPSLISDEERHYQNVSFHQGAQDPRMGSHRGPRPSIPQNSPHERVDHRPASAFLHRDEVVARNDLQRPASQRDIREAKFSEMSEEARRRDHRHGPPQQLPMNQRPQMTRGQYNPPVGPSSPMTPQFHGSIPNVAGSPSGNFYPHGPNANMAFHGKHPPPTAPKPNKGYGSGDAPEKPQRHFGYDPTAQHPDGPPRPPLPDDNFRESPPPPPPPTSTHPLLQTNENPNRPGTNSYMGNGHGPAPAPGKFGPNVNNNAWDKSDKEKYDRQRKEAFKQWRDEQIATLLSIEHRTPQEDERLRALTLEREFQRRAEEALLSKNDDEDGGEDLEDDDNERTDHEKLEQQQRRDYRPGWSGATAPQPNILANHEPRVNGGGPDDENRAKKADEIRRKQQELEAVNEDEMRILREAQRRQEEDMRRLQMHQQHQERMKQQQLHQQQMQQQQMHQERYGIQHQEPHKQEAFKHQHHASQRLDTLVGASPHQTMYPNDSMNDSRHSQSYYDNQSQNDSNTVHQGQPSPLPPERGSSYSIMQQQHPATNNISNRRPTDTTPVKRVQFSEATTAPASHITFDNNANHEKPDVKEDPNDFINEAETFLNSSPSRGNITTPGVIGAQEVYRDPRQRRLMEAAKKASASQTPVPEKLTFREKMKMFAKETGEAETPKDKMKTSRAQRDIEHPAS